MYCKMGNLLAVLHTDEFWVWTRVQGLNGTGTVGTAGTPVVWVCNLDDLTVLLVVHMAVNPHLDTWLNSCIHNLCPTG